MKHKKIVVLVLTIVLTLMFSVTCFAGIENIGQSATTFIAEQASWIGWGVLAVILISLLTKRAFTTAIITGIAGSVLIYIVSKPEQLKVVGETLYKILLG